MSYRIVRRAKTRSLIDHTVVPGTRYDSLIELTIDGLDALASGVHVIDGHNAVSTKRPDDMWDGPLTAPMTAARLYKRGPIRLWTGPTTVELAGPGGPFHVDPHAVVAVVGGPEGCTLDLTDGTTRECSLPMLAALDIIDPKGDL